MPLRTDRKDFVLPAGEQRKFRITSAGGIDSNIEDITIYEQDGDFVSAIDLNAISTAVNDNMEQVGAIAEDVTTLTDEINAVNVRIDELPTGGTYVRSLTEQVVGTNHDGKPIYGKIVLIPALPAGGAVDYAHGAENVDIAWVDMSNSFMKFGGADNGTAPIPYVSANGTVSIQITAKRTVLTILPNSNRSTNAAEIAIQYTKTTDPVIP